MDYEYRRNDRDPKKKKEEPRVIGWRMDCDAHEIVIEREGKDCMIGVKSRPELSSIIIVSGVLMIDTPLLIVDDCNRDNCF